MFAMRARIDLSRHGFSFSMSANNQHHVDDLFMVLCDKISNECPDVCILVWVNAQPDLPSLCHRPNPTALAARQLSTCMTVTALCQ